jgi:hypothetical protein
MGNMRERYSRDRQLTCHRTEAEMDAQVQRDPAYGKQEPLQNNN